MVSGKSRVLIFLIFLTISLQAEQPRDNKETLVIAEQTNNTIKTDDSFDFDSVTAQMIEVGLDQTINSSPPSAFMVLLRKLGMPIIEKIAEIYQKCSELWHHAKQ